MSRPRRADRVCPTCMNPFYPRFTAAIFCSKRCAAIDRIRRDPADWKRRHAQGQSTRRKQYALRLKERFKGMTIGDVYRHGYTRGYRTGWDAGNRHQAQRIT